MLKVIVPQVQRQAAMGMKWFVAECLRELKSIYEFYRDGYTETREDLREVLKAYFAKLKVPLTHGQLEMLAPERAAISEHGGPAQFAKYAWQTRRCSLEDHPQLAG